MWLVQQDNRQRHRRLIKSLPENNCVPTIYLPIWLNNRQIPALTVKRRDVLYFSVSQMGVRVYPWGYSEVLQGGTGEKMEYRNILFHLLSKDKTLTNVCEHAAL